jgi:hypothetical protein
LINIGVPMISADIELFCKTARKSSVDRIWEPIYNSRALGNVGDREMREQRGNIGCFALGLGQP